MFDSLMNRDGQTLAIFLNLCVYMPGNCSSLFLETTMRFLIVMGITCGGEETRNEEFSEGRDV